jgi:hypothetical protein
MSKNNSNAMLFKGNFKDDGNFTADLQNVSLMSIDESIGKIEVNPKEEASVVEVFQDVLDKLSDVKTINKTSKSPYAFAMCSIRTDLLKQENEKIDSL